MININITPISCKCCNRAVPTSDPAFNGLLRNRIAQIRAKLVDIENILNLPMKEDKKAVISKIRIEQTALMDELEDLLSYEQSSRVNVDSQGEAICDLRP